MTALGPCPELLENALQLAGRGLLVAPGHHVNGDQCSCGAWPCGSRGKHPRTGDDGRAVPFTTDANMIKQYWARWPWASIRLATGPESGLLLLDLDRHGDADGPARLAELEAKHGALPPTWTEETPTGGEHRYFKLTSTDAPNLAKPAPGVELIYGRNPGTCAPSLGLNGKCYRWQEGASPFDLEPAAAPEWLVGLLHALPGQDDERPQRAGPLDGTIPQGQRRDAMLSLAGTLRRRGLDGDEIFAALKAVSDKRCSPPCSDESLRALAEDIARKDGGALALGAESPADPERLVRVSFGAWDLLNRILEKPQSVIGDGLYCHADMGVLFGPGGAGKSQSLIQLAVARALGADWFGFTVGMGRTGLLMLELDEIAWQERIRAAAGDLAGEALEAIRIVCRPHLRGIVDLGTVAGLTELRRWIEAERLTLAGLDPLIRIHNLNENKTEDMAPFLNQLDVVRLDTGCALWLNHHTRKGQPGGHDSPRDAGRGTGAITDYAAFQAIIEKKGNGLRCLTVGKASRGAEPPPVWLARCEGSAVLRVTESPTSKADANRTRVLGALCKLGGGVKSDTIAAEVGLGKSAVTGHLGALEEQGKVRKEGQTRATTWWPVDNAEEVEP